MTLTYNKKQKIAAVVLSERKKFKSDAQLATWLGIKRAAYSRVFNLNEWERVISDDTWLDIARMLGINLKETHSWVTVETPTFSYIYEQLSQCQNESISLLFCDEAGIGKTYTARQYVKENEGAVLIDCSQCKNRKSLIKEIAKEFRVPMTGNYSTLYDRLKWYLNNAIDNPLIILDEAGDLQQDAILELKALWNGTEKQCGWYMMGADGLKRRMEKGKENEKVGYVELFDRYGKMYQNITQGAEWAGRRGEFHSLQLALIAQANAPDSDPRVLIAASDNSLRRINHEVIKLRNDQSNLNNGAVHKEA